MIGSLGWLGGLCGWLAPMAVLSDAVGGTSSHPTDGVGFAAWL